MVWPYVSVNVFCKMTELQSPLLIYASEAAACIGENKYKKRYEALTEIFKRLDSGSHYQTAIERLEKLGFTVTNTGNIVDELKQDVEQFISTPVTTSSDLSRTVGEFELKIDEHECVLKETKRKLKEAQTQHTTRKCTLEKTFEKLVEKKKWVEQQLDSVDDANPKVESLKSDLQEIQQQLSTKKTQIEDVQKTIENTLTLLTNHQRHMDDFKHTKKDIISRKQTQFGHEKEDALIKTNKLGSITQNNSQFYKKMFGTKWGIGGRIDGFRDGALIEIKNRKSKIYDPLPVYDQIQLQCYMQILNLPTSTLIQCLTLEDGKIETKETVVPRDDKWWTDKLFPALEQFAALVDKFVRDTLLQDRFLQTPDSKKTVLLNSTMKRLLADSLTGDVPTLKKRKLQPTPTLEKKKKPSKIQKKVRQFEPPSDPSNPINDSSGTKDSHVDESKVLPEIASMIDDPLMLKSISPLDFSKSIVDYMPDDWKTIMQPEITKDYFTSLITQVDNAYKKMVVYPNRHLIFNALTQCPFNNTKVVILALDPYINPLEAHGMSFSVPRGIKFPGSLRNIFKELTRSIGVPYPTAGDLTPWAQQGVLLLNSILTVQASKTQSHEKFGWKTFTNELISTLSKSRPHLVFLLWGNVAQEKEKLIDATKHTILKTSHPSGLSVNKGFAGCDHFRLVNDDLNLHNLSPIDWKLE